MTLPEVAQAAMQKPAPGSKIKAIAIHFEDQAESQFDELATAFALRQSKTRERLANLNELPYIDRRIDTSIGYLSLHQPLIEELTDNLIEQDNGLESEAFAAAVLAFSSDNRQWIERAVNGLLANDQCRHGVAFALAWLPREISTPWLQAFMRSKDLQHKWLAARSCNLLGLYPGDLLRKLLAREDCREHLPLYTELLSLVGYLKAADLLPALLQASEHDNAQIKTAALRSRLLLGDNGAVKPAVEQSLQDNDSFVALSDWLIRGMPVADARYYLSRAMQQAEIGMASKTLAIAGHGDPALLSWLLNHVQEAALMPWLGLAFYHLTGVALADQTGLVITDSETLDKLLVDDKPAETGLEEDLSLPFPDRDTLLQRWQTLGRAFSEGTRYFLGQPIQPSEQWYASLRPNRQILVHNNIAIYRSLYDRRAPYAPFVTAQIVRSY